MPEIIETDIKTCQGYIHVVGTYDFLDEMKKVFFIQQFPTTPKATKISLTQFAFYFDPIRQSDAPWSS